MMENLKRKSRERVVSILKRSGYDHMFWNEDGSCLEASMVSSGITIDKIVVNFSDKGRAK